MGIVLWHIYTSLDGVIARPGDDMKWIFELAEPDEFVDEVVRTTGAVIMGRRTYEVEDRDRPGIYGGAWTGPLFVVTHEPPSEVPDWMTGTFVMDGVESALEQAKAAAGDKNIVLLGANLARQCLELDRLDEILVQVTPILLGDGVRLFSRPDGQPIKLEKLAAGESGQITDIRYRVVK
jgi:dihydrofolate reductase